jgi:CubicO group peptidase (beta-lactamase class C family)
MESRVFAAGGLDDTTFDPASVAARGNASWGHMDDGAGSETEYAPDEYDNGEFAPAGYAYSTAGDLVRWALLLADGGGNVLSPASAATMQAPHQDMQIVPGMGYGYGIFVEPFYDLTVRQHGGNIWGWGSYLLWHPGRRFAVAVLANTFSSMPDAAYCIADAVLEPDHSAAPDYPFDPDRMALFEATLDASIVTGRLSNPYPVMAEADIQNDEQMLLFLWDPESVWSDIWTLDHQVLDVFYVDVDHDGEHDFDVTFLTSAGQPEYLRWLRMRPLVGSPQRPPRSATR